jgi:hypothetical protein
LEQILVKIYRKIEGIGLLATAKVAWLRQHATSATSWPASGIGSDSLS